MTQQTQQVLTGTMPSISRPTKAPQDGTTDDRTPTRKHWEPPAYRNLPFNLSMGKVFRREEGFTTYGAPQAPS